MHDKGPITARCKLLLVIMFYDEEQSRMEEHGEDPGQKLLGTLLLQTLQEMPGR